MGTPFSDRPTDTAPGHWVLARAGKRVLRPGGAALSAALLANARLAGVDVVELAPGLGRTAAAILDYGPASYTGVDREPQAVSTVAAVIGQRGTCIEGDAAKTGLPDASAEVVVGEAMLTMQGDKGKRAIIAEAARLLRPGGRYAIHELAVQPDDIAAETHTEIRQALAKAIHVNARPMTVGQWKELLEEAGLEVEWVETAPMALLKFRRNLHDEGLRGVLRILRNVLRDAELRRRVRTMAATFRKYEEDMCGVAIIARKPETSQG